MAQRNRNDERGAWLHVMNRGVARRTIAETKRDARRFLASLARATRRGWFTVHAYALLTTHFHLLIRSTRGECHRGMRLFQNEYARWFNRTRRRDGALFRGRFMSRRVWSSRHWEAAVRYIDHNAVDARLVHSAEAYPYGSAAQYHRRRGPPWLARSVIEEFVRRATGRFDGSAYDEVFGNAPRASEFHAVAARLIEPATGRHPLDDLLGGASDRVRDWMIRKAELADGIAPGVVVLEPSEILVQIDRLQEASVSNEPETGVAVWPVLRVGLLRSAAGLDFRAIGRIVASPSSSAHNLFRRHQEWLATRAGYADLAANALQTAFAAGWTPSFHSSRRPSPLL